MFLYPVTVRDKDPAVLSTPALILRNLNDTQPYLLGYFNKSGIHFVSKIILIFLDLWVRAHITEQRFVTW